MVRSARIHRLVKDAGRFGTTAGAVELDWPTVVRRQHDIVKEFQPLPASLARAGAEVVLGEARFSDPHTIAVNGLALWGEKIIIGAGSAPVMPTVPGVEATITSDDILFLPVFPRRLVIVGAGVIGLEMAGAFSDFGADVSVIGQDREILPTFDADVAGYVRKILESRGVTFHLGATVAGFSGTRGAVTRRRRSAAVSRRRRSRPSSPSTPARPSASSRSPLTITTRSAKCRSAREAGGDQGPMGKAG